MAITVSVTVGRVLAQVLGREESDLNQAVRHLDGRNRLLAIGLLVCQIALSILATVVCAVCVLNTSSIILGSLATLGFAFFGTLTAIGVYLGVPVLRMVYSSDSNSITTHVRRVLDMELTQPVLNILSFIFPHSNAAAVRSAALEAAELEASIDSWYW